MVQMFLEIVFVLTCIWILIHRFFGSINRIKPFLWSIFKFEECRLFRLCINLEVYDSEYRFLFDTFELLTYRSMIQNIIFYLIALNYIFEVPIDTKVKSKNN